MGHREALAGFTQAQAGYHQKEWRCLWLHRSGAQWRRHVAMWRHAPVDVFGKLPRPPHSGEGPQGRAIGGTWLAWANRGGLPDLHRSSDGRRIVDVGADG